MNTMAHYRQDSDVRNFRGRHLRRRSGEYPDMELGDLTLDDIRAKIRHGSKAKMTHGNLDDE